MKKLALGIFVLQILALASATNIINEIQQDRTWTPENLNAESVYSLDLDAAFDIFVLSVDGPSGQKQFCDAYPSEINATVVLNSTIAAGTSYDNIIFFEGHYYAVDTYSWTVLVADNISNSSTYRFIEVDISINHQSSVEIPVLVIDEAHKFLYIFRKDQAVSYSLISFWTAVKNNQTYSKISHQVFPYKSVDVLKNVKYYNKNFHFIINNNTLEVWTPNENGNLVYNPLAFDMTYFGTGAVDITDIVFRDSYAFVLDELNGVYVLDVTTNSLKYVHLQAKDILIPDARLIDLAGNSLNVLSMSHRSTVLHEYTINTTGTLTITLNREIDLQSAVRNSYSDTNFLYYITGFQNLIAKHSIPKEYNSDVLKSGYTSYWNLSNFGAFYALANGSTSQVVTIQKNSITVYNVSEAKATLKCHAGNYKHGSYVYTIESKQRTCKAKNTSSTNDICVVKQKVTVNIDSSVKQVESSSSNAGLIAGIIIAVLVVVGIAFSYWFFKLRSKDGGPTVRNDVFFRRLSRSPLNADASNLYKVTMDIDRSGARHDGKTDDENHLGDIRKKSDDFVLGPQRSDDNEDSPKKPAIVRGKTFSEIDKPKPISLPNKTNTLSNIEGGHKDYEADI